MAENVTVGRGNEKPLKNDYDPYKLEVIIREDPTVEEELQNLISDCKITVKKWELWMMTLVNRRKYQLPKKPTINLRLDQANLMNVIHYINHIPSIESAILYYQEPQHPRVNIFMLLDDVVFILGFSSNKITINSCMGQILKSALLSREIKKIVHYNPCLGEETSFNMPSKKDEIINFIRKHNKLDPVYPENFLIKGLTKYFVNIPDIACQHHSD
ncbi:hypothetical protein V9T40_009213 [Parthenolecanium corni]|uniref:Uncharacterized protein n=1 Tax=Parthenolecanium corni TaxID=536013 RepID=A0AAN9Y8K5_9HEMI